MVDENSRWVKSWERINKEELLEKYAKGIRNFEDVILKDADLSGANLKGIGFIGSKITEVKFRGADLKDANFSFTLITNVDFSEADLSFANFKNANLIKVNLSGANLKNTVLDGTYLWHSNYNVVDLSHALIHNIFVTD